MLAPEGQLATVAIGDVVTEAGEVIADTRIAYRRWGALQGDPNGVNNVILVEHALTGDSDAADWWSEAIGPGKALDTDEWCVICTNALGSCYGSTGPASEHPDGGVWGSRFPAITIRDMVHAEHAFLDRLGIGRVHAVIGGSMGGARTLEWTLLYPEQADYALVLAVSARASAWQIGIQTAQITSITQDPAWQGGDYHGTGQSPDAGLAAARRIAHLTYRGEMEIDERFGTSAQTGENPLGPFRQDGQRFAVQSYLEHQGTKLTERFDAACYVTLTEALNRHDIGRGRGGLNKALASSTVPTMIVGVDTDILYPYHQQEHISRNLGNLLAMSKLSSPVGHDAFLVEARQMDRILRNFIKLTHEIPPAREIASRYGDYAI
ncbi:homoserine O-acetyltransferase [Corynebacterium sp. HMSC055D05]|uniref:homoserine O-acetyltransferase MetX n=1 Tax=Corynebacterium sp. HMSC055D05 TaxID=1715213 RepID=UPI0008A1D693|nr:homoserine O-acetyltransferase [Corynebacterium sp. HMSC055D05]OFL92222.1 homoserine O-acetyltransferase [Corynebacterium sp. HMSC055D05]